MEKDTARKLLLIVNNPEVFDAWNAYVSERIEINRDSLERTFESEGPRFQGALSELRLMQKDFRQRVLDKVK